MGNITIHLIAAYVSATLLVYHVQVLYFRKIPDEIYVSAKNDCDFFSLPVEYF